MKIKVKHIAIPLILLILIALNYYSFFAGLQPNWYEDYILALQLITGVIDVVIFILTIFITHDNWDNTLYKR